MTTTNTRITITEPSYYHREFKNDVLSPKEGADHLKKSLMQQFSRVALVALPYVSLYRPVGAVLSCTLGTLRTCTSIAQTIDSLGKGDIKNVCYGLLQTTISAAAIAGTIFAHPAGMLISTTHDLLIETCQLIHHLQNNKPKEALNSCLNLFNNALYLSLFMYGGLELSILSLAGQILLGLYHAHNEYRSGRWLEAAGHIGMAAVRSNQLLSQAHALRLSLAMQESKNQDERKSTRSRAKTTETRTKSRRENRNKTAKPAASPQNTSSASGPNNMPAPTPYRTKVAKPAAPSQDKATESAPPQTNAPTPKTLPERIKEYESNSKGWPVLHYAIHRDDEEAAQYVINTKPEQAKLLTPDLPIMQFHDGGNADKDFDYKIGDEQGISAVELAARQNFSSNFVSKLIDLGADFRQGRKDYLGTVRDNWESKTGYVKEKNKLASFFGRSEEYQLFTPIYWAINHGNEELVDLFISKGSNLNDLAYAKRSMDRGSCRIVEEQYTAQQLQKK